MNLPLILAAKLGDAFGVILFLIILSFVGISKIIQKLKESGPPPPRRPRQSPPPTWQANQDEVRKFLDQLSRGGGAPPVMPRQPPLAEPLPPLATESPPTTFRQHVESDEDEDAIGVESRELLQSGTEATHVERGREIEESALTITRAGHVPTAVGAHAERATDLIAQSVSAPMLATGAQSVTRRRSEAPAAVLRKYLRYPGNARTAYVLTEILGPPRGL